MNVMVVMKSESKVRIIRKNGENFFSYIVLLGLILIYNEIVVFFTFSNNNSLVMGIMPNGRTKVRPFLEFSIEFKKKSKTLQTS